jgi:predicted transcriptional regulator
MSTTLFTLTPTEVARSHAEAHPGYELISYGEVGVPFFELKIEAEVLAHKPIDPFAEFVLRATEAGVTEMSEMEGLLGLDAHVLDAVVVPLVEKGMLESDDDERVTITDEGRLALEAAAEIRVESQRLRVVYDPLLRQVEEPYGDFLQPRELKRLGIREVAVPAKLVPSLTQLDVREVEAVIKQMGGAREQTSDILALRDMRRYRVFNPGVAMVFRAEESDEVVVDVAFDGQVSERHTLAFAELGLKNRLRAGRGSWNRSEDWREDLERPGVELDEVKTRSIPPYELPDLVEQALRDARQRVVIGSAGLQGAVLEGEVEKALEGCLKRGVSVYLIWGFDENAMKNSDPAAIRKLDRLANGNPNLIVGTLGTSRNANILVRDDNFGILTEFRLLSHQGDSTRPFQDERGLLIENANVVRQLAESWIEDLQSSRAKKPNQLPECS